jgi:hypothetical protein
LGRQPRSGGEREQPVAAELGERRIDERDVGACVPQKSQRLACVTGIARELQLWMLADDATQCVSEQGLRLDDSYAGEMITGAR